MSQLTPEVTWAQRSSSSDPERNYLYVNIKTPDVAKSAADLKITANNVSFTGETNKGAKYHVSLNLYAEIDPENSKVNHTDREVELVLRKKELKEEYWPRLVKDTQRLHFLKTDFDKWVDEDEQDEAGDDDYANNFGGLDGLDQGGLGNIDFSKLGANLGGGADGVEAMEGAEGEESDEEMPELEGDSKAEGDSKVEGEAKSSKIQEVS